MEAEAIVMRIERGVALLRLSEEAGGCERCHESGGCRSGILTRPLATRCRSFRVPNTIGARPGDRVVLDLPEGSMARAAAAVYLLPAVLVVAGAAAGMALSEPPSDLAAATGALVGLLGGAAATPILGRRTAGGGPYRPVLRSARPDPDKPDHQGSCHESVA